MGELHKQRHLPFIVVERKELFPSEERLLVDPEGVITSGGGLLFFIGRRLEGLLLDPLCKEHQQATEAHP